MVNITIGDIVINPDLSEAFIQEEKDSNNQTTGYRVYIFRSDTGSFTGLLKKFTVDAEANAFVLKVNNMLSQVSSVRKDANS